MLNQDRLQEWEKCDNFFTKLHVTSSGTIEDDGAGMLQVSVCVCVCVCACVHACMHACMCLVLQNS